MATVADYEAALDFVLANEGGWYDGSDPRDPNPTMRGVTQGRYDEYRKRRYLPLRSVREIEDDELETIYTTYWVGARCYMLPRLTATSVFDHAVNAGASAAIRATQRAVGTTQDGVWGPVTQKAVLDWTRGDMVFAVRVTAARQRQYLNLARRLRLRPNFRSWILRTTRFLEMLDA